MKLKTLLIAGASLVAFAGADALAGGHMKAGEKGRHGKHAGKHGKHAGKHGKHAGKHGSADGAEGKDGAGSAAGLWKSGFTVGAMVGWQHMNPKKTTIEEFATAAGDPATPAFKVAAKKSNGVVGGVFVGYNHFIKNILVGVQTGGEWNSGKSKKTFNFPANAHLANAPASLELKKRWSWLLHAKFGYAMGKMLPYVKLGTAMNGYRITEASAPTNYKAKWTKTGTHFAPAIGVDYAVNKNISVGVEAMHEFAKKITTKIKQDTKVRTKPSITTVKFGVAYRM